VVAFVVIVRRSFVRCSLSFVRRSLFVFVVCCLLFVVVRWRCGRWSGGVVGGVVVVDFTDVRWQRCCCCCCNVCLILVVVGGGMALIVGLLKRAWLRGARSLACAFTHAVVVVVIEALPVSCVVGLFAVVAVGVTAW